VDYFQK
jgi:hypothetical protein